MLKNHTKGNWTIETNKAKEINHKALMVMSGLDVICLVCPEEKLEDEDYIENQANAKLIAAAPDLLECCIEFVRKCDCGEARSKKSYAQMKKALEKAIGIEA